MPVGHRNTAISNGHTTAVQRTSSFTGSRGRPGCTRYQWPSSIASLTAPRNAAPTSEPRGREQVRAARELRRREQAERAERPARSRSSAGGNSGSRSRSGISRRVAADHRRDTRPALGAQLLAAAHAGAPAHDRHHERDRGRDARTPIAPASATTARRP